jgi:hypothetical protein
MACAEHFLPPGVALAFMCGASLAFCNGFQLKFIIRKLPDPFMKSFFCLMLFLERLAPFYLAPHSSLLSLS